MSKQPGYSSRPRPRRPASSWVDSVRNSGAARDRTAGTRLSAAVVGTDLAAGDDRCEQDFGASVPLARDLAWFIRGVRSIDTRGRSFAGDGRGGDLRAHDAWMEECFAQSGQLLDVPRLRRLWAEFRNLPRTSPDVMTHGDLIPGNVLVADGRLSGVIDVGGLGPADPALDLVAAWHLLEPGPRRVLRDDLGCDDLDWARGRAWAFEQAMGVAWYYADSNPAMHRMGLITLERILAASG